MTHAAWVELWFPEADQMHLARYAQRKCEKCPVRIACLEESIQHPEQPGLWGGVGQDHRRALAAAYRPGHTWSASCGCRWCQLVTAILDGDLVNINGPGAQCGKISTYARRCRCRPCRFEMSNRNYSTKVQPLRKVRAPRVGCRGETRVEAFDAELVALRAA